MERVYYPITQYHVILAILLQKKGDSIVLDERLFTRALIDNACASGVWDKVYVIKRQKGIADFVGRFLLTQKTVRQLLALRGRQIVFFSYGFRLCVYLVNLLARHNEVVMMEDGMAPYYMSDLAEGWLKVCENLEMPAAYVLLWRIIRIKTDSSFVSSIHVLNEMLLSDEMRKRWKINQIGYSAENLDSHIPTINRIFGFLEDHGKLQYDVVYFDNDIEHAVYRRDEFQILHGLFSAFVGKKVLVKLRICGSGAVSRDRFQLMERIRSAYAGRISMDIVTYDIPWEVVHMNNREALANAIFVSMGLTTVMLTPALLLGQGQASIICQRLFLADFYKKSDLDVWGGFVDRINRFNGTKRIRMPETFSELREIVQGR
ncbi:MAG: hypothetical protein HGB04_07915 [Chlorobiaceae bacterium]|nr:hypothetical protein [Chlorobiaceae bacterium]